MLIRVFDEIQMDDEKPKACIGFQADASDAPGIAYYTEIPKWKLIRILIKSVWVVFRHATK